jgi:RNA polymerase sigma-70 factor (ECF subfamily)
MMPFVPFTGRRRPLGDAAALVARLASGDRAALEELYRHEAGPVYRYVLALCAEQSLAADATHEAFLSFAAKPGGFDPGRGTLGAYLAGVARHALLAALREARRAEPLVDADGDDLAGADEACPESIFVREQRIAAVWEAIRALPWPFREAVVLVDLQDRPYAEAAAIAGVEQNTLRTRVFRGRRRLAALLDGKDL